VTCYTNGVVAPLTIDSDTLAGSDMTTSSAIPMRFGVRGELGQENGYYVGRLSQPCFATSTWSQVVVTNQVAQQNPTNFLGSQGSSVVTTNVVTNSQEVIIVQSSSAGDTGGGYAQLGDSTTASLIKGTNVQCAANLDMQNNAITNVGTLTTSNATVSGTLTVGGDGRTNWFRAYTGAVENVGYAFMMNTTPGFTNDAAFHSVALPNSMTNATVLFGECDVVQSSPSALFVMQSGSYTDGFRQVVWITPVAESHFNWIMPHSGATNLRVRVATTISTAQFNITGYTK
jgi:hypothetical protein